MRQNLIGLFSLFLVFAAGCGGSNGQNVFVATSGSSPIGSGNGTLIFNFVQAQTSVPTGTTELQFRFFDSGNTVVSSANFTFSAQIRVENVPQSAVRVEVTSLNVDGLPLALSQASLDVMAGTEQTVDLTTTPISFDTLIVDPGSLNLIVPETAQLTLQGTFGNGFVANIDTAQAVFSENDIAIATVDSNGLVTSVGSGSTTLKVTYTLSGTTVSQSQNVSINVVGPINLTGAANTFDTDTGFLNGSLHPGWDGAVLRVSSFQLPDGAVLTVSGTAPFQLQSLGDITIDGLLDASGGDGGNAGDNAANHPGGPGGVAGPGGFAGGAGGGVTLNSINGQDGFGPGAGGGGQGLAVNVSDTSAGGGGAGHAMPGIAGTTVGSPGTVAGTAGVAYNSIPDSLIGGSGGGGGSLEPDSTPITNVDDGGAGGGGGGGAVRLTASGVLTVGLTGIIDCSGGNGGSGGNAGGGGGGSGGSIELLASTAPLVSGSLDVSGGTGGPGPDNGAPGGGASDGRSLVQTLP